MDLSLLPSPASVYNRQGTEALFTVRSANSPSYSLTRRPGVRKPRGFSEEERKSAEEVAEAKSSQSGANGTVEEVDDKASCYQARSGNSSRVISQYEDKDPKMSTMLSHTGRVGNTITAFRIDRGKNIAPESRGRTEFRRNNLATRSKSLEWQTGERCPDRGQRADMFIWLTKRTGDIIQPDGGLDESAGVQGTKEGVRSSIQAYYNCAGTSNVVQEKSPVSHMSQTLDRTSKGRSLPSRLRSQSGPCSNVRPTSASSGSKGGQSILERIEKLYGSAGFGKTEESNPFMSLSVDESGLGLRRKERDERYLVQSEGKEADKADTSENSKKYARLKSSLEIPINKGDQRQRNNFYIDESDFSKLSSPEEASDRPTSLPLFNSSDTPDGLPKILSSIVTSPVSDEDRTPTNTPNHSPLLSPTTQTENSTPIAENERLSDLVQESKTPEADALHLHHHLGSSSHSNHPGLVSSDSNETFPKGKKQVLDLDAWVAGLSPTIKVWNDDEDDFEDDDESTQKDEDSNYDSDSGESSVTITSNMSQSDRRSFCVSLSDLCNFAGVDYESENDSDEWQSVGRRTASLSSDMSAFSYVSVMPADELDKLLEDVRSLGDSTLQDYNDVQVVVLHKDVGVGLGFSLAGGIDQNKPVTVHKVFHLGVAAKEGSICEGDQVLSINGTALSSYAHWEALRVLRRAKTRDLGVVVLRKGGMSNVSKEGAQTKSQEPTATQTTETGQLMCVRLEKNNRDLGFSLEGGVGSSQVDRPLTVQKIFQGGPVDKVCPGDEVVEIEGVSMGGMRRLEVWTLIRRLPPGPVDVVLRRPLKHLET
uniref:Uncharacterized LOC109990008 n=1 Tax=Labrus bergylta TaxID=56723 RepID=A0A3Q3LDR3_9LABR